MEKQIDQSEVFANNFTGFALMDAESGAYLHQYQADKYFTPASNIKILTLYTCLQWLGDSIPTLRYETRGDSLLFWGTGDPSLLNPQLANTEVALQFLSQQKEPLYFCPYNFQDVPLGAGWAWDDFNYYFQPEKSALPIYGNLVNFRKESNTVHYEVRPPYFDQCLVDSPHWKNGKARVRRQIGSNTFEYNLADAHNHAFQAAIPFRYSDNLLVHLLEERLSREVKLYPQVVMPSAQSKTIYSIATQAAYQQMMQESDNFISEQLLLLCANQQIDTLNTRQIISKAKRELLSDLPDPAIWVDGSGLSRYNLLSPRSLCHLLLQIQRLVDWKTLQNIFPAGGQSGTIKNWYGGGTQAYVFAKTGTLSNVHCLSGYLVAKSGKRLIFSFMHNNYTSGSRVLKEEMEKILRNLYLAY